MRCSDKVPPGALSLLFPSPHLLPFGSFLVSVALFLLLFICLVFFFLKILHISGIKAPVCSHPGGALTTLYVFDLSHLLFYFF